MFLLNHSGRRTVDSKKRSTDILTQWGYGLLPKHFRRKDLLDYKSCRTVLLGNRVNFLVDEDNEISWSTYADRPSSSNCRSTHLRQQFAFLPQSRHFLLNNILKVDISNKTQQNITHDLNCRWQVKRITIR